MKKSIVKRILAVVLAATLVFGAAPAVFASEAPAVVLAADEGGFADFDSAVTFAEEAPSDDIRDDPTFQESLIDIVISFAKAFVETMVRYIKYIIEAIMNAQA